MSATICFPSSSKTSATTTLAPSRAKIRAMLAPIPEAAPVIRATFSSSRIAALPRKSRLSPLPFPRERGRVRVGATLNHGDLLPQLAGEKVLRDHRVDPAHDIDD